MGRLKTKKAGVGRNLGGEARGRECRRSQTSRVGVKTGQGAQRGSHRGGGGVHVHPGCMSGCECVLYALWGDLSADRHACAKMRFDAVCRDSMARARKGHRERTRGLGPRGVSCCVGGSRTARGAVAAPPPLGDCPNRIRANPLTAPRDWCPKLSASQPAISTSANCPLPRG